VEVVPTCAFPKPAGHSTLLHEGAGIISRALPWQTGAGALHWTSPLLQTCSASLVFRVDLLDPSKTCVFHLREYTHVISLLSLLDCSPLAISHFILLAYRIDISMIMSHGHSCLLVSMTCGLSVCVYDHLGRWHVSGHSHERYYP
jgi:hypothetical protein